MKTLTALCSFVLLCGSPLFLCADEPLPGGHFTLTDLTITPIDRTRTPDGKIHDKKSDTLTHWIRFDVKTEFDRKPGAGFKITNAIDTSKNSVTVDKDIKLGGKDIKAGTNLMTFKKFNKSFSNISMPTPNPLAIGSITIRKPFEFPPDDYTFTFKYETKTGEKFAEEVKVRIDLKK